jgi:hypothetical protein
MMHPQLHDVFLTQFVASQFTRDPPVAHDIGAIADVADFGLLRRDHQRSGTIRDQSVDEREDLGFGSDIDAACRLVEDEQLGPAASHLPMTTFCWLPPDRSPDGLLVRWGHDPQLPDQIIGNLPGFPLIEEATRKDLA